MRLQTDPGFPICLCSRLSFHHVDSSHTKPWHNNSVGLFNLWPITWQDGEPGLTVLTNTNKTNSHLYVTCLVDPGRPSTRPPEVTKKPDAVTEIPFLMGKDLLSNLASLFWSRWF
ncbi:hypothetical protein GDO81_019383 [Engystomops pustulosus]|uniref:Uncharacterized protein n=1 Tax=Engystomops pustulosus TaxID=76066 RepID=A0AAV6Z9X1_ENGPU|nr:hypothetical protein GDO81_019383 [Engystomops pustulosus]